MKNIITINTRITPIKEAWQIAAIIMEGACGSKITPWGTEFWFSKEDEGSNGNPIALLYWDRDTLVREDYNEYGFLVMKSEY